MRLAWCVPAALLATFLAVTPAAASSATSWRATIVGTTLHGGATTLIQSDGTGSINVKVYGVTPGVQPLVLVNPSACPDEAQNVFGFELSKAGANGISTGRHALTTAQVRAYNAALSRRIKLSLLVVTQTDKGCGNQVGAPSIGTARVRAEEKGVYAYDFRYPVVGGIDGAAASAINSVLKAHVDREIADILERVREFGDTQGVPLSDVVQTFSIRLSQAGLLSVYFNHDDGLLVDATSFPFALTFDTTTGRVVTLDDIVTDRMTLQAEVRRILAQRGRLFTSEAIIHPDTPWNLEPSGIAFTFNNLQAVGIPPYRAVVPWAQLRADLVTGSPVAALAGPGPCLAGQLRSSIDDWEGGAGSRFTTVHLWNVSSAKCFLRGTPQSQLIDALGRVLLDSGRAGPDGLPHVTAGDPRLTLAPGAGARIGVQTTNFCGPAPTTFVRVALRLPGGADRVISTHAPDASADDVPPCFGPTARGAIVTMGWRPA